MKKIWEFLIKDRLKHKYFMKVIIRVVYALIMASLCISIINSLLIEKGCEDRVKTTKIMCDIYNKMIIKDTIYDNNTAITDERILVSRDILICEGITPYMTSVTHDCDNDVNRMWANKKTSYEKQVESANLIMDHISDWNLDYGQNLWWESNKINYIRYWE